MASRFKNTVSFVNVAPGATVSLPHGLNVNGYAVIPDAVTPSIAGVAVITGDATNVSITNTTGQALSLDLLCEYWHSIERGFGVQGATGLAIRPFTVAQALALSGIVGSIVYGSGQDGSPHFDGVNVFAFATLVGGVYTLNRDVFLANPIIDAG